MRRPIPRRWAALFEQMGFIAIARHRAKNVLLYRQGEINFIVNAEPGSFAQAFARVHGPSICAIAFRVKDAAQRRCPLRRTGRLGGGSASGADGAQHPGDQGHRRLAHLPGRPISGQRNRRVDLRHRLRAASRASTSIRRARALPIIDHLTHNVHRGRMAGMGGLLRAAVQFSRDPLLRHRGQADRPQVEGDDEPVREDPHPDQRERRRQEPDPGIPRRRITARASSTSRSAPTTSTRRSSGCVARGVNFQETPDTYYELLATRLSGPRRGHAAACGRTASCSTARRPGARCCCRSSRRP